MKKDNIIATEQQETRLFQDACQIIEQAQESAYRQVNETLIKRNWLLGMRINMDVLKRLCKEHLYTIGAGIPWDEPDLLIRYVIAEDKFGYKATEVKTEKPAAKDKKK